jgi:predicted dehydrogenase
MIGVGVIGCGYWGPHLVRNFSRSGRSQVVAVCDAQYDRAARVGTEYHVPLITTHASEVIAARDVQLVVIATPSYTHYPLAKAALEAGKHALVMKPLATRADEAAELVALAERRGLVLAVDHTFVYTGAVRKIKELVEQGELGDIFYVDSVRINLGLFQSDVNVVWDLAPHDISIIDYLLGGPEPREVSAIGARHVGSPTENIAYLTLRYSDQLLAHVHVNWLAPAKVRRTIVGGSKRMLIYDDVEPSEKVKIYDKGVTISQDGAESVPYAMLVQYRSGDMHAPRLDTREALAVEANHVLECIHAGQPPLADGAAGLRVVRVLEAAQRSIDMGGLPVALEPRAPEIRVVESA